MKLVIVLVIVAVGLTSAEDVVEERAVKHFVCRNNVRYVENDCNNCNCNNGILRCTLKACRAHRSGTQFKCLSEPIVPKENEMCWCLSNVGKLCGIKFDDLD